MFFSLSSLEMPTGRFYTQRVQASLAGAALSPVRPVGKVKSSLPAEMGIWKWASKGMKKPAGGDINLTLQVFGIDRENIYGETQ